ncbi:MAG: ACP phosphodiesterase [Ferruginibacter sp.]
MNYLAHACLSFNNAELLTGNMISDFVKGKKQFDYPPGIRAGIQLHRAIDEFTDLHPATQEVKKYFRPAYRLYAGAFADVVYDHFLANDTREFPNPGALKVFTTESYTALEVRSRYFPEKFAVMFPYMRSQDWLYHYRLDEGMRKSFGGLARRAMYIAETDTAFSIFLANKAEIKELYDSFFPDVKIFAARKAAQLLTE